MRLERSVGARSPVPFAAMALNGAVWALYGVTLRNWVPLVASNIVAFVAGSQALSTFHKHARGQAQNLAATLGVSLTVTVLALMARARDGLANGNSPGSSAFLGNIGIVITVGMFASPLVTFGDVIRTRSTASLSPLSTGASLACTSLWTLYGSIIGDIYLWGPNLAGLCLSLGQGTLFLVYGCPSVAPKALGGGKTSPPSLPLQSAELPDSMI